MTTDDVVRNGGLVPLASRIGWTVGFRTVLAVATIGIAYGGPGPARATLPVAVAVTICYVVAGWLPLLTPRTGRRVALSFLAASLLLDGLYFGWAFDELGGFHSAITDLIVLHAMGITLLASFRTGLKVALWHSIVILCVIEAQVSGLLGPLGNGSSGNAVLHPYVLFLGALWSVVLMTATLAAANERELKRRRYDAEVLRDLALSLERQDQVPSAGELLTEFCIISLGAQRAMVAMRPRHHASAVLFPNLIVASAPGTAAVRVSRSVPAGPLQSSVLSQAVSLERPVLLRHIQAEGEEWLVPYLSTRKNVLVAPVPVDNAAEAWLLVEFGGSSRRKLERRHLTSLQQAASQVGLALSRAGYVARLRYAAECDGLTGLLNRGGFDTALADELALAHGSGSFALMVVDLDFFKKINDSFGHVAGDAVLVRVAAVLRNATREGDVVARYGGEEFVVIMPGVPAAAAERVADGIRATVAASTAIPAITCSIGVAVYPEHGLTGQQVLIAADEALYEAKESGRNQVVVVGRKRVTAAGAA